MNMLIAYKLYKIVLKTELEDGYIENIRVLKHQIFNCVSTLVPQIGQTIRWRRQNDDESYIYYNEKVTNVDIPLYQVRTINMQLGDTKEIIIPPEDYNYFLIGAKNSDKYNDILSKHMKDYNIYDWLTIRDYRTKSKDKYNNNIGETDVVIEEPEKEVLFESDIKLT